MHPKQIMNQIIERINKAAAADEPLMLNPEEVKILSEEIGDLHFIPVLTNEQLIQLCNEGKLGQKMVEEKINKSRYMQLGEINCEPEALIYRVGK